MFMNCPFCQGEMKEGFLKSSDIGNLCFVYEDGAPIVLQKSGVFRNLFFKKPGLVCPKCKKILLDYENA